MKLDSTAAFMIARICAAGLAQPDELVGCTEEEIRALEIIHKVRLPKAYRDFLTVMGHGAGRMFNPWEGWGFQFECVAYLNWHVRFAHNLLASGTPFPMPETAFFIGTFQKLIEATRPKKPDTERHVENLTARLRETEPEEIASFENQVLQLQDEAYDASVLEVLWILTGGGPGDEGWSYFTNWLILQGEKTFQQIQKVPERLPELYPPGTDIYAHGVDHAARGAYEESSGRDDFDAFYESLFGAYRPPDAPKGAEQDPRLEDEYVLKKRLKKKYPTLWEYESQYD